MLEVYKLTKRFGERIALDGVTFRVGRGETLAVMGPSGCGKSTLLLAIQRLVRVDSGEIWFGGEPVMHLKGEMLRRYRRRIGFVFQRQQLVGHLDALENVLLGPVLAGTPERKARRLAEQALEQVGLLSKARDFPATMSGGERQRVGIARALAMQPELILWDEPTAALDPMLVDDVIEVMTALAKQRSTAMIVVTHELPFALQVADRVVLMERGAVVGSGPPREVLFGGEGEIARRLRRLYEVRYGGTSLPAGRRDDRTERSDEERRRTIPAGRSILAM